MSRASPGQSDSLAEMQRRPPRRREMSSRVFPRPRIARSLRVLVLPPCLRASVRKPEPDRRLHRSSPTRFPEAPDLRAVAAAAAPFGARRIGAVAAVAAPSVRAQTLKASTPKGLDPQRPRPPQSQPPARVRGRSCVDLPQSVVAITPPRRPQPARRPARPRPAASCAARSRRRAADGLPSRPSARERGGRRGRSSSGGAFR